MAQSITKDKDYQIHRKVLEELRWDTQVDETEVGVEVDQGIVTLTGTVSSYAKKMAAQDAAHRVTGVLDVANDIQVHSPSDLSRTDTQIAQAIRNALEWDVLVPQERIRSTVVDGWVTLAGEVAHLAECHEAERAIRHLAGVRGITNGLTVSAAPADPAKIRAGIEDALQRRAQREAGRITVEVHGGKIRLSGAVHSWFEKQAVLGVTRHAPGVHEVEDTLRIDPTA